MTSEIESGDSASRHAIATSDLLVTEGRVYHLDIGPELFSPYVITVGDPGRTKTIADAFFDEVEADVEHRGLRSIVGRLAGTGLRVMLLTSGMGTPSLEIVLTELAALNEIDLQGRVRKDDYAPLTIIRVGTSGALQASTPVGTSIITEVALGLDNTGLFYDVDCDPELMGFEVRVGSYLAKEMRSESRFRGRIMPYAARADAAVVDALSAAAQLSDIPVERGITVSNSGFFASQGRDILRVSPSAPNIDRLLAACDSQLDGNMPFLNMEMESSFLLHLSKGLGYRAGAICVGIANRDSEEFTGDYASYIEGATRTALSALEILARESGDL